MPQSETSLVERLARVLAGWKLSGNADGEGAHAGTAVDMEWRMEVDQAIALLRTMREPDARMVGAGDLQVWQAMIAAAMEAVPDDEPADLVEPTVGP